MNFYFINICIGNIYIYYIYIYIYISYTATNVFLPSTTVELMIGCFCGLFPSSVVKEAWNNWDGDNNRLEVAACLEEVDEDI